MTYVSVNSVPFEKLPNTKAWKVTSELVRTRANGICYTCGGRFPMNKLVAGHFREKRGSSATYFDLDNLRAQCSWNCNRQGHGRKDIYATKLIKELGPKILDVLQKRAVKAKRWSKEELNKITEERSEELVKLKELE